MPTFYVSITASIQADNFDEAYKIADEAVSHIDDHNPYMYDTSHFAVEQDEFEEDEE